MSLCCFYTTFETKHHLSYHFFLIKEGPPWHIRIFRHILYCLFFSCRQEIVLRPEHGDVAGIQPASSIYAAGEWGGFHGSPLVSWSQHHHHELVAEPCTSAGCAPPVLPAALLQGHTTPCCSNRTSFLALGICSILGMFYTSHLATPPLDTST